MRIMLAVPAAIGLLLAGSERGLSQAAEDAAVVAARTRQACVKTAMLEYKRTEVIAKGGLSQGGRPPFDPATPAPGEETTLESVNRVVMDGEKLRYEDNHPLWHVPDGKFYRKSRVCIFNASGGKTFYPNGLASDETPTGLIMSDNQLIDIKSPELTPITVVFRGLSPTISPFPMGDMKPSGAKLPIDGAPCQEYVISYPGDLTVGCWLDSSKDYVLRRVRKQKQGHLLEQTDITAYQKEVCGMVPASWVNNRYSPGGSLLTATRVQVLELRVNDPQPENLFDLMFPEGTTVQDAKRLKDYRVQSDGSMRELSPTGVELRGSVPQPGAPWYDRHKWLVVGMAVLCALAGLYYTARRLRTRTLE